MQALERMAVWLGPVIVIVPSFRSTIAKTFNSSCSWIVLIVKSFLRVSSMLKEYPYRA